MRSTEAARHLLNQAHDVLGRIDRLVEDGRERLDADPARRQQLRYLWIVAGSLLKNYCAARGIEPKASVFTPVIDLRQVLAYHHPDDVDDDWLWTDSVDEIASWLAQIEQVRRSLP